MEEPQAASKKRSAPPSPTATYDDSTSERHTTQGDDDQAVVVVHSPSPERVEFATWDEAEAYLASYWEATFQLFRVRTSTSVAAYNKIITKRIAERERKHKEACDAALAKGEVRPPRRWAPSQPLYLVPETCLHQVYCRQWTCTHAGKPSSRGTGKRVSRKTRATECEVVVDARIKRVDNSSDSQSDVFHVFLTDWKLIHNHVVNQSTFENYASNRVRLTRAQLAHIDTLRKNDAKAREILEYIHENNPTSRATIHDVRNLLTRLKNGTGEGRFLHEPTSSEQPVDAPDTDRDLEIQRLRREVDELKAQLAIRTPDAMSVAVLQAEVATLKKALTTTHAALTFSQREIQTFTAKYAAIEIKYLKSDQMWQTSAAMLKRTRIAKEQRDVVIATLRKELEETKTQQRTQSGLPTTSSGSSTLPSGVASAIDTRQEDADK